MLLAKHLMSESLESVARDAYLHDALIKMNTAGYRHLPVVDGGRLVGIITDRDVRLAVNSPIIDEEARLSREAVLDDIRVEECMTPDPQCVTSQTPATQVAEMLTLNKFGAMPVVDDGTLVGMISSIDFLKHFAAGR